MRSRVLRPAVGGALAAALLTAPSAAAPAPVAKVLQPTLVELKERTELPVVLPSVFPVERLAGKPLYPEVRTTARRWDVTLGFVRDCNGANVCSAGYLSAVKTMRLPSSVDGKAVRLAGGITGRYRALSCGASCSPPEITFRRFGMNVSYQLKLRLKAGETDRQALVRIANSAILGGRR